MRMYLNQYCPVCGSQMLSVDGSEPICSNGCDQPEYPRSNVETLMDKIKELEERNIELDKKIEEMRADFEKKLSDWATQKESGEQ